MKHNPHREAMSRKRSSMSQSESNMERNYTRNEELAPEVEDRAAPLHDLDDHREKVPDTEGSPLHEGMAPEQEYMRENFRDEVGVSPMDKDAVEELNPADEADEKEMLESMIDHEGIDDRQMGGSLRSKAQSLMRSKLHDVDHPELKGIKRQSYR